MSFGFIMQGLLENHYYTVLAVFLSAILAGNIPVGILRRRFPKFSRPWARCIYIPVLFNVVVRRFLGITYKAIPLILIALLIGQFIGARVKTAPGRETT